MFEEACEQTRKLRDGKHNTVVGSVCTPPTSDGVGLSGIDIASQLKEFLGTIQAAKVNFDGSVEV